MHNRHRDSCPIKGVARRDWFLRAVQRRRDKHCRLRDGHIPVQQFQVQPNEANDYRNFRLSQLPLVQSNDGPRHTIGSQRVRYEHCSLDTQLVYQTDRQVDREVGTIV